MQVCCTESGLHHPCTCRLASRWSSRRELNGARCSFNSSFLNAFLLRAQLQRSTAHVAHRVHVPAMSYSISLVCFDKGLCGNYLGLVRGELQEFRILGVHAFESRNLGDTSHHFVYVRILNGKCRRRTGVADACQRLSCRLNLNQIEVYLFVLRIRVNHSTR